MSGIDMFVGSAQAQADSIRSMTDKEVQGYEAVIQSLNQFLNAADLRTDAYDNGKAFFSGVLIPTLQAAILVSEAVGKAAQKFVTDYQSTVDPGDLKSGDLEEKIERLNTQLQHLDYLTQATSGSDISEELKRTTLRHQKQQRNHLLNAKKVLQETLDDLLEFHAKSPGIFSDIAELEAAAKQGASQAKSGFNGQKFIMPADLAWMSFVSSKWKEYQEEKSNNEFSKLKERIKKEKLPTTKAEILAEYHWSTIHNMYVHTKTGIPSPEVTKLYNKLVQAEHEPQQDPQLAFYNEMLRTGKHPITGKAITEAERLNAKAMVYAIVLQPFYYAALVGVAEPYLEKYIADLNEVDDIASNGTVAAKLRGELYGVEDVDMRPITFTKQLPTDAAKLRSQFKSVKKDFLKQLAKNPEYLKSAGFSESDIASLAAGNGIDGWQVHHQVPLDGGGTNDLSNLVLIKNEHYHKVLTNYQRYVTKGMKPGDSIETYWPFIESSVYPLSNP